MEHGAWSIVYGVWSIVHGVWSMEWGRMGKGANKGWRDKGTRG